MNFSKYISILALKLSTLIYSRNPVMVQRKQAEMDTDASSRFADSIYDSDYSRSSSAARCSPPVHRPNTSNTNPEPNTPLDNYDLQTAQFRSELTDELIKAEHAYKSDLLRLTGLEKQLDQAKSVFKSECDKIAHSLRDQNCLRVNSDATISRKHTNAFYNTYMVLQNAQAKYDTAQSHVQFAKNKMDTLKSFVDKVAQLAKLSEQIELKLSINDSV